MVALTTSGYERQLMDTRDNDQDISCERHEHICHQPKKASNNGTWVMRQSKQSYESKQAS